MAAVNGDIKVETAESFARDYLDDLFNNNKNLGAFEEETLDVTIKSKYDDIEIEENSAEKTVESVNHSEPIEPNVSEFSSVLEVSHAVDAPPEPEQLTLTENGHDEVDQEVNQEVEVEVQVLPHNNHVEQPADIVEPGQVDLEPVTVHEERQFTSVVEPELSAQVIEPDHSELHSTVVEPVLETSVEQSSEQWQPPQQNGDHHNDHYQSIAEEQEETQDEVAPIPTSRAKSAEPSEEEMHFQKLGLTKNWWDSKRTESQNQKEVGGGQPIDKFRTIKQNIKRGNTRSLLARFENMSKLTE